MEEKKKSSATLIVLVMVGLMLGSVAIGCGASFLLYYYASSLESETEALMRDQREVVKASRTIPAGTIFQREHVTTEKIPERFLPSETILVTDLDLYIGMPVNVSIEQGAMMRTSDFR